MATVSGMKQINYTTPRPEGGKYLVSGSVVFSTKLDGHKDEVTLTVPFKDAESDKDAHNQALKVLHAIAAAFTQIQPRVTDTA